MKKLNFLLLCFYTVTAFSQQFAIANMKENIVYCGVENPLYALVAGSPCTSVVLTTDNGTLTKADCGYFICRPIQPGNTAIKVWVKNGKQLKKVGEMPYIAKRLPPPVAFIGVQKGGDINLKFLKAMGFVRAVLLNLTCQPNFQIVSYTATAIRDSLIIFTAKNTGPKYNESLLKNMDSLKAGDSFLVSAIICKGPDEKGWKLDPLEFTIIE